MIERFMQPRVRQSSSRYGPVVLAHSSASLPCGCAGYVGRNMTNGREVITMSPCSEAHDPMIGRVYDRLSQVFLSTPPEQLTELVDRLLAEESRV